MSSLSKSNPTTTILSAGSGQIMWIHMKCSYIWSYKTYKKHTAHITDAVYSQLSLVLRIALKHSSQKWLMYSMAESNTVRKTCFSKKKNLKYLSWLANVLYGISSGSERCFVMTCAFGHCYNSVISYTVTDIVYVYFIGTRLLE